MIQSQADESTPKRSGFLQPAEWARHRACWLAWPSHRDLWKEDLIAAQSEFTALCRAIVDIDPASGEARGESLEILVPDESSYKAARKALGGVPVRFHQIPFGDIWLRDTAPVFLSSASGEIGSARFKFNGWGGKYILPGDDQVASRIAAVTGQKAFSFPWVLEGGSIDVDGEGTCLTTRQCLLNPNRNPAMSQGDVEAALSEALGINKVLWLGDGLINDHTDGHVDTLARFVAPGTVVCMESVQLSEDPNHEILSAIARDLESFTDAQGRRLRVVRIPSPGKLVNEEGRVLPASYVNFYIGNSTVVVPTYGSPYDAEAVAKIGELFPGRRAIGSSALTILTGGGAFHCITQQQPSGGSA